MVQYIITFFCCLICLFVGRYCESKRHKYVGKLIVTRDKEDGEVYLTCDLSELNSIEQLYSYDTVTLKIQRL